MPLKLVPPREGKTPNYYVRGTYLGQRVNESSGVSKRALALKALKKIERDIERGEFAERGAATFAEAALNYMEATDKRRFIKPLLKHFGEKPARLIDQTEIDAAAVALYPKASPATRNRQVYTPVCAILNHAKIKIDLRRPEGSGGNKATAWLWPEQAFRLFEEAKKIDATFEALCIALCYTGMRLSEALSLTWDRVRLQESFAYVPTTKNAEPRAVHLPAVVVAALANIAPADSATPSRVFRFAKSGHLYSMLRVTAIKAGVDLPERSAFHIFRHTYATWMRRDANVDTKGLVATGAWKDRKSVDRYEHVVTSEEARKADLLPTPKVRR